MEYSLLKLIHLGSLILWLGPAFGSWLVLKAIDSGHSYTNTTAAKVSRAFFLTITLEHIAFVLLLVSGAVMALKYGLFETTWLQQKILIIAVIVIPLEIIDIFVGNWVALKASEKLYAGLEVSTLEAKMLHFYHGLFTKIAIVLIPISVVSIMFIAVSKKALQL